MVASDKEVAMVTWTQLLTFVLVIIAVIDLTVRAESEIAAPGKHGKRLLRQAINLKTR